MLYKSSRLGFTSARALLLLTLGAACSSAACVGEDEIPTPTPPPQGISASRPPPPISGGTLLVTADKKTAVAADSDRDRIMIVDLAAQSVAAEIKLQQGVEPGRVVEGAPGQVFVALRQAGAIATIDLAQKKLVGQTAVCPAPRGMAYDNGQLHVACAGGELVTLDASTNAIVRRLAVADDLRDVVVQGSDLLVSQFRAAKVLRINASGAIVDMQSTHPGGPFAFGMEGAVAWRMISLPTGGVGVVHQSASTEVVVPDKGGYGQPGPCSEGIVNSFVSVGMGGIGSLLESGSVLGQAALPVDMAVSPDGTKFAVIAAGSSKVVETEVGGYIDSGKKGDCGPKHGDDVTQGQPVAVAYADSIRIIQTREPARIIIGQSDVVELGGESMYDTGHAVFHQAANPTTSMACAGCHPEGHEDGRVWQFVNTGPRRTQSIAGGILATAPFHWAGDLDGFDALMTDVFTGRMSGRELVPAEKLSAAKWIDSIPAPMVATVSDTAAVERGKALYNDATVGCGGCHSGLRLTNNQSVDVGTFGGAMQVPSLQGLAARAPYMHDGCAPTLEDRFTNVACGGGDKHGRTSQLTGAQIADLVAYLKTL